MLRLQGLRTRRCARRLRLDLRSHLVPVHADVQHVGGGHPATARRIQLELRRDYLRPREQALHAADVRSWAAAGRWLLLRSARRILRSDGHAVPL